MPTPSKSANSSAETRSDAPDQILLDEVRQVMHIESQTWGGNGDAYLVTFRGQLSLSARKAYHQLAEGISDLKLTPLFKEDAGQHLIQIKNGVIEAENKQSWPNLVLFVITFFSILFAGLLFSYTGPQVLDLSLIWAHVQPKLGEYFGFAVSLLAILTAHEFGHYFAARKHRTRVTLPYFIPFPISPFGTMGAFIRLQEPPRDKRVLLDIGLAGPVAGLLIAVPVLIYGLSLSTVQRLPQNLPAEYFFEGNSLLYLLLKYLVHNRVLPDPVSFQGLQPFVYWVKYFFTGAPLPHGAAKVIIHPVAYAGWAGLLVTAFNLIPVGQLDGGHLMYSLLGNKAKKIWPVVFLILVALGFVWMGWWLWAGLILIFGRTQAEPLDQITELNPARKMMAVLGLVIFLLVFTPVPIVVVP